jgi:hypothetical protein
MISWIIIELAHWHKSQRVDISPLNTSFWFRAYQSLFLLLNAVFSEEATNTNITVFDLTRPWFEPTIHHTWGENSNHYPTDEIRNEDTEDPLYIEIRQTSITEIHVYLWIIDIMKNIITSNTWRANTTITK